MLRKFIELLKIDKFLFLKFYLNKNIKGLVFPYKNTKLRLGKNSKITVGNVLLINSNKILNSKKESYVDIRNNSEMIINKSFSIFYNGDICVFENAKLEIGSGFMNAGSQIRCQKYIKIGKNVAISRNVMIWDTDAHKIIYEDGRESTVRQEVIIGDNVWIGNGSIILKGVYIGDNVVIGAGSIVNKDIPSNCIAVGNPAKVVKKIKGWGN